MRRLIKITVIIASLIFCYLALEITVRIFFKESLKVPSGSPLWEPDWGDKYLRLNNDGFRDRQHSLNKPAGVIRIAIIGDSYTFGWLIDDPKDRYSEILEHSLNSNARKTYPRINNKYEVMNFSYPGIGTLREMEIYENSVKKYNPDIVILGMLPNDILLDKTPDVVRGQTIPKEILKHSYLLQFLMIKKILYDFKSHKWLLNYVKKIQLAFQNPVQNKLILSNISEFKNRCNKNNSDFYVLFFPLFLDFKKNPLDKERLETIEMLSKNNIDFIDLFPYFKGLDVKSLTVTDFDPHPNEKAHLIISNALFEKLIRRNLVRQTIIK